MRIDTNNDRELTTHQLTDRVRIMKKLLRSIGKLPHTLKTGRRKNGRDYTNHTRNTNQKPNFLHAQSRKNPEIAQNQEKEASFQLDPTWDMNLWQIQTEKLQKNQGGNLKLGR